MEESEQRIHWKKNPPKVFSNSSGKQTNKTKQTNKNPLPNSDERAQKPEEPKTSRREQKWRQRGRKRTVGATWWLLQTLQEINKAATRLPSYKHAEKHVCLFMVGNVLVEYSRHCKFNLRKGSPGSGINDKEEEQRRRREEGGKIFLISAGRVSS